MVNEMEAKSDSRARVAVIQACWVLQIHTVNFVRLLVANGFEVDVFLVDVPASYVDVDQLRQIRNVRIIECQNRAPRTPPSRRLSFRVKRRILRTLGSMLQPFDVIGFWLGDRSLRFFMDRTAEREFAAQFNKRRSHYDLVIGVESVGLILGHKHIARHTKLVYYSLELYLERHPLYPYRRSFRQLKRLENQAQADCVAIIIQDLRRGKCLAEASGSVRPLILLPVSLSQQDCTSRGCTVRESLGISAEKRIVIYFGAIRPSRYTRPIVEQAQHFPEDWTLVVHSGGDVSAEELSELQALDVKKKVVFSLENLPEASIHHFLVGADVGLVFYSKDSLNEFHTGYASEKAARYAAAGIPFVAFDVPTFEEVFNLYHCGTGISKMDHLPSAITEIFSDYQRFQQGAEAAFEHVYCFERHASSVVKSLRETISA